MTATTIIIIASWSGALLGLVARLVYLRIKHRRSLRALQVWHAATVHYIQWSQPNDPHDFSPIIQRDGS